MSSMKRHRIGIAAVAVAACLAMTACGGSASDDGTSTIRFMGHSGLQESLDPIIEEFEKAHPDITVEAEYSPAGPTYGQTLVTQVQAGNAPDIFYTNGGDGATESLLPMAEAGQLLDLSDEDWVSNIPEEAKDLYQVDGRTYGLLMDEAPHGILYKVSTWDELGIEVPTTYDEVLDICATARANDKYAIALPGQNSGIAVETMAASLVLSQDPEWNTSFAAGDATFSDTEGWVTTMQRVEEMAGAECFQPGAASAQTADQNSALTSGQALMAIAPSGTITSIADGRPEEWAMAPFPGDSVEDTRLVVGYQDGLAASADTESPEAVREFLAFIADEGASTRAEISGTISLADAREGALSTSLEGLTSAYEDGRTVSRLHDTWSGGGVFSALSTATAAVVSGQSSVEDALADVDATPLGG